MDLSIFDKHVVSYEAVLGDDPIKVGDLTHGNSTWILSVETPPPLGVPVKFAGHDDVGKPASDYRKVWRPVARTVPEDELRAKIKGVIIDILGRAKTNIPGADGIPQERSVVWWSATRYSIDALGPKGTPLVSWPNREVFTELGRIMASLNVRFPVAAQLALTEEGETIIISEIVENELTNGQ